MSWVLGDPEGLGSLSCKMNLICLQWTQGWVPGPLTLTDRFTPNVIIFNIIFLVICAMAGYRLSANTIGSLFQKYVYSSFSMKMVLNYIHIWSVDLFLIKNQVPGRNLIKMQCFETW